MTRKDFTIMAEALALACDLFSSHRFARDAEAFARAIATQYPNFNCEAFLSHTLTCHRTRTYPTLKGPTP